MCLRVIAIAVHKVQNLFPPKLKSFVGRYVFVCFFGRSAVFMSVSSSESCSIIHDSSGPMMENYDLTTTPPIFLLDGGSLLEGIPQDDFTFVINRTTFTTSIVNVIALSPTVRELYQVDACTNSFVINDPEIYTTDFSSLQCLLSRSKVIFQKLHQKSLLLFSQQLSNSDLELLFSVCGMIQPTMPL